MINKEKLMGILDSVDLTGVDLTGEEEKVLIDFYSNLDDKKVFESIVLKLLNYNKSILDKETGLPKIVINILQNGKANEEERKILFDFFKSRSDIDNYGGGGVDGGGIYSDYILNYKKPSQVIYKVYEI